MLVIFGFLHGMHDDFDDNASAMLCFVLSFDKGRYSNVDNSDPVAQLFLIDFRKCPFSLFLSGADSVVQLPVMVSFFYISVDLVVLLPAVV